MSMDRYAQFLTHLDEARRVLDRAMALAKEPFELDGGVRLVVKDVRVTSLDTRVFADTILPAKIETIKIEGKVSF